MMKSDQLGLLIKYGRILYEKGLIAGFDGNLSCRLRDGNIAITPSGAHKGFLKEDELVIISPSGNVISGLGTPSSETLMHLEIYRSNPACNAIIHTHAPWSTAVSLHRDRVDLTGLAEGRLLFGGHVEIVPYFPPGSRELAHAASRVSEGSKAFILKSHGAVSMGVDLMEAFGLMEALEHNIKILGLSSLFLKA